VSHLIARCGWLSSRWRLIRVVRNQTRGYSFYSARENLAVDTEKTKQLVQDRIARLRGLAESEADPWTRELLRSAAADFESMLTRGDSTLFSLAIAMEEDASRLRTLH
jgi:hypothetical protein